MQISAANLLIASTQGKPAPKAEPGQSFSAALGSEKAQNEKAVDFAPLSFKAAEKPATSPPAMQPAATPYGTQSVLGSQLDIVV